jgi:hypothetical protein
MESPEIERTMWGGQECPPHTPVNFLSFEQDNRSKICLFTLLPAARDAPPRLSGHNVRGGVMQDQALGNSTTTKSQSITRPHEGRSVWVLTMYAVSGLALFGVLIYYVSAYITQ